MAGYDIEIILSRQLADCLTVPVFIVDPEGTLLFYNEPAETILGKRFEDTGPMPVKEWSTTYYPHDGKGNVIHPKNLPLVKTLNDHLPAHKSFWIRSMDGKDHNISVTSFPLIGRSQKFSGAIAIFWTHMELK